MLRVGDENAGKQARCPKCGTIQTIPGELSQPMAPVEPPAPLMITESSPHVSASAGGGDGGRGPQAASADVRWAKESGLVPDSSQAGQPAFASPPTPAAPAATSSEQWYVLTPDGREYGPVARSELDSWVGESRISTQCRLRRSDSEWMSASFYYANLPTASNSVMATMGQQVVPTVVYPERHRAATILLLGIFGLLCTCPLFSIAAWVMGAKDLGKMRAQVMDPAGFDTTRVGYVLGMLASIFWIGIACLIMAVTIAGNL